MKSQDKSNLLKLFLELVHINSPTGQEKIISDYIFSYLVRLGLNPKVSTNNNVFVKTNGVGEPIFLSAHMDTVQPGLEIRTLMKKDTIKSIGNTILGADNKSTISVFLTLVVNILKDDVQHRPLEILFTVDEESRNTGAKKFDISGLRSRKGIISDISAPIGTIVLASPAYIRFDIEILGKSYHAAFPDMARNVLPAISKIIDSKFIGKLDKDSILNIGILSSGSSRNTIPGSSIIQGEIRSFREDLLEKHLSMFLNFVKSEAGKFGVKIKIKHEIDNPAYVFDRNDKFIAKIAKTMQEISIKPAYIKSWSCSDANIFNSEKLQVINIGDGTNFTHTTKENIDLKDMMKLYDFFYKIVTS